MNARLDGNDHLLVDRVVTVRQRIVHRLAQHFLRVLRYGLAALFGADAHLDVAQQIAQA